MLPVQSPANTWSTIMQKQLFYACVRLFLNYGSFYGHKFDVTKQIDKIFRTNFIIAVYWLWLNHHRVSFSPHYNICAFPMYYKIVAIVTHPYLITTDRAKACAHWRFSLCALLNLCVCYKIFADYKCNSMKIEYDSHLSNPSKSYW